MTSPTSNLDALKREASRIEEDALYSARGHFEAAGRWAKLHLSIGLPSAVLAALAGVSALSEFEHHDLIAAILSISVAALTAVATFLNSSARQHSHHEAGTEFAALRNQARIYREIGIDTSSDVNSLVEELKILAKQRDDLNAGSPQIPRWAFRRARRAIDEGEAGYEADSPPPQAAAIPDTHGPSYNTGLDASALRALPSHPHEKDPL
jgi:hypothetical protein